MEQEKTKGSEFFKSIERIEKSIGTLSGKFNVLNDRLRDFCIETEDLNKVLPEENVANESHVVTTLNGFNKMLDYQINKVNRLLNNLQI